MKVYILYDDSGEIRGATLIRQEAIKWAESSSGPAKRRFQSEPVDLSDLVADYFRFRGLTFPNQDEAFLFLVSEIGELADKLVHNKGDWLRNNPDAKNDDWRSEVGDVLMMLCMTAGEDPVQMMVDKFKKKGYPG